MKRRSFFGLLAIPFLPKCESKPAGGWISIDDRLPELDQYLGSAGEHETRVFGGRTEGIDKSNLGESRRVLLWGPGSVRCIVIGCLQYREKDGPWWVSDRGFPTFVTHWMELPSDPTNPSGCIFSGMKAPYL